VVTLVGGVLDDLREQAADLDLLVVGTHQQGALTRLLAGSVSRRLAHSCPAPLAAVPGAFHSRERPGRV
jgi:nucleotide-binding universal stress UspA family protein